MQIESEMNTFDSALEAFTERQTQYLNGDPAPVSELWSTDGDVTLCNPVGPPTRGPENVKRVAAAPSTHFSNGTVFPPEEISRYVSDDLGYVVRIERGETHIDGSAAALPYALRVTMVFRREGERWKIAHRHADTVLDSRPIESVVKPAAK
jgi:ketosteroid isomerase-like protein